jgi:hypothetical protein
LLSQSRGSRVWVGDAKCVQDQWQSLVSWSWRRCRPVRSSLAFSGYGNARSLPTARTSILWRSLPRPASSSRWTRAGRRLTIKSERYSVCGSMFHAQRRAALRRPFDRRNAVAIVALCERRGASCPTRRCSGRTRRSLRSLSRSPLNASIVGQTKGMRDS